MSAFLRFLADLTPIDWLFILGAWLMVAFSLGAFTGMGIKRADEGNWTDRTLYQPPVPTQADVDAVWLSAWPAGDEDETDLRFQQIIAAEGLA